MCCMPAANTEDRSVSATIFNDDLYQALVKRRKEQGLPPLEETPGLDRTSIWRIRNSLREPRVGKAILLARVLGTAVEDLWPVAA